MTSLPVDDLSAVRARAKRRFRDYDVDLAYPVCLPVYDLRIRIVEHETGKLSTAARFVLMLANVPVADVTEIRRFLGLSEGEVVVAAAELLSAGLVEQQPDQGIRITELGRAVLKEAGRTYRPRNRHPRVPYDPLVRTIPTVNLDELLDREEARREGLFIPATKPRRPRLSQVRLAEVQDYEEQFGKAARKVEILQVADIKDVRLRYRRDVVLVRLLHRQSRSELFVAYRAQQYLERESEAIQRLAGSGFKLVPQDVGPEHGSVAPWERLRPEESRLAQDIGQLDEALGKAEVAVADAESLRSATQDERERTALEEDLRKSKAERDELRAELREKEQRLEELSGGEAHLVRTEGHRPLLFEAARLAKSELTIVSAWVNSRTLDEELCGALIGAISRGVTVRIAWGFGTRGERDRNRVKGDEALAHLMHKIPKAQRCRLIVRRIETHEKFMICDDRFCVWGSFNWLSYRGQRDEGYRRETSSYSERPGDVELWKANAATLFG
ncbi:MAG: hypothetical protein F4X99_02835 [Gammaproteobacteria bacterium]|nr:hypothetical protein [Gammaproteobacteria bacterium]